MGRSWRSIWSFVARPLVVPRSSSGVLGPSVGLQFPLLSGSWKTLSVFPGFSRLWIRFSSSHCWSLLHWRHLSMFWLASAVDCSLSSPRAGVCGLLQRRWVPARVLMVACLPLLRVWRTAPSHIPLIAGHPSTIYPLATNLKLSCRNIGSCPKGDTLPRIIKLPSRTKRSEVIGEVG